MKTNIKSKTLQLYVLFLSVITGQAGVIYYIFLLSDKNKKLAELLVQQTSEIHKMNHEIKLLSESLETSRQVFSDEVRTIETVKDNSYMLFELLNSPVVYYCVKTGTLLVVGYIVYSKISAALSPLYFIKNIFTGIAAGGYTAALNGGDTGNYVKGVYNMWFGSSFPVDETAVLAKLQTSADVLPLHITADLLPNNVISDLHISIGDNLHVPVIPLIWTTLQFYERYNQQQQSAHQRPYNDYEETTTIEEVSQLEIVSDSVQSQIIQNNYSHQIETVESHIDSPRIQEVTVNETDSSHNSNENLRLNTETIETHTLDMIDTVLNSF